MRFSPVRRHPLHGLDAVERALAQRVALARDIAIHRDEPLRRVAEDHRLLRAPGMRILMLQPPARDQHAGIDQRLDHRLVGIALLALVGEHALALEARRFLGEAAVGVDGEGDARLDAARASASRRSRSRYRSRRGHGPARVCTKPVPSSSVTWSPSRSGTSKVDSHFDRASGCATFDQVRRIVTVIDRRFDSPRRARLSSRRQPACQPVSSLSPRFAQLPSGAAVTSYKSVLDLRRKADRAVAGNRPRRSRPDND